MSSGPAQHVFPTQPLTLNLHRNEPGIGFGVRRHPNVDSVAWAAAPAQQAAVTQSLLSGEGLQREPAAPVGSENLRFLFGSEVASDGAGLR